MTTPETLPRADVLAAVRATWDEATREKHGNPIIALTTVLRVLGMGEHVTVKDGRAVLVNDPPRTPEMVLRAMLRAYEAPALAMRERLWRDIRWPATGMERIENAIIAIRNSLGATLVSKAKGTNSLAALSRLVRADYEARLAGTRPLDAPPLEMP